MHGRVSGRASLVGSAFNSEQNCLLRHDVDRPCQMCAVLFCYHGKLFSFIVIGVPLNI